MKVIMISEEEFEKEFKHLLKTLQVDNLESVRKGQPPVTIDYDLHRKFVYELHLFKEALMKAKL